MKASFLRCKNRECVFPEAGSQAKVEGAASAQAWDHRGTAGEKEEAAAKPGTGGMAAVGDKVRKTSHRTPRALERTVGIVQGELGLFLEILNALSKTDLL